MFFHSEVHVLFVKESERMYLPLVDCRDQSGTHHSWTGSDHTSDKLYILIFSVDFFSFLFNTHSSRIPFISRTARRKEKFPFELKRTWNLNKDMKNQCFILCPKGSRIPICTVVIFFRISVFVVVFRLVFLFWFFCSIFSFYFLFFFLTKMKTVSVLFVFSLIFLLEFL